VSAAAPPSAMQAAHQRYRWFPYALLLPALVVLVALTIFPLVFSLGVSLTGYGLGRAAGFVGLANYAQFLRDPSFWLALRNTLVITVFAVGIEIALGVCLALLFRESLPGFRALSLFIFIPMMLSPLVIGFFWKFMFDSTFGVLAYFTTLLTGRTVSWLTSPRLALAAIIVVDTWQWTPFAFLLTLAGLQTVPPQLYEAASLERASAWMRFRRITLPYLRFPLLLAVLFRTIDTVRIFDLVYIMTGGGPGDATITLSVLAYRYGFQFYEVGRAAAVSWLIVVLINLLVMVLLSFMGKSAAATARSTGSGRAR